MPTQQLGCAPHLASPLVQEQWQQILPRSFAVGGRKYVCGCPPGMKPSAGGDMCFPAECGACPDDEVLPPIPGWYYTEMQAGWLPKNLQGYSQVCCPYPAAPHDAPQPPSTRCPPGYRWEDTEHGWVCIPEKKSMDQATMAIIIAGGNAPGTTRRQRRMVRKAARQARISLR